MGIQGCAGRQRGMGWGVFTVDFQRGSSLVLPPVALALADLHALRGHGGVSDVQDAVGGEGGDGPQGGVQPHPFHLAPWAGQGTIQLCRAPERHQRLPRCHHQPVRGAPCAGGKCRVRGGDSHQRPAAPSAGTGSDSSGVGTGWLSRLSDREVLKARRARAGQGSTVGRGDQGGSWPRGTHRCSPTASRAGEGQEPAPSPPGQQQGWFPLLSFLPPFQGAGAAGRGCLLLAAGSNLSPS